MCNYLKKQKLLYMKNIHDSLSVLVEEVSKRVGFKVICGYRGKIKQEEAFKNGNSKAKFGQSPHNYRPALAIDIIPDPFKGWNDYAGFNRILEEFLNAAKEKNIEITLGRDFKTIKDYPHIELKNWKIIMKNL